MGLSNAPAKVQSRRQSWLTRIAERAPVRVFALIGRDPPGDVEELRLDSRIRLLDSPRSASVLLVAGVLPRSVHEAAKHVHDAMAPPRQVVLWQHGAEETSSSAQPFPEAEGVQQKNDLISALVLLQQRLLCGDLPSSPPLLPDVDPAPWRGIGPYGQGGSGMTGGVPYGRPMTERAPDRDGLELDQLPVRVGPFFPAFPPGLVLDVKLQGDVVQEVGIGTSTSDDDAPVRSQRDAFHRALAETVRVADLERARACHHLRWLAHALRLAGLDALGLRARSLVQIVAQGSSADALGHVRDLRILIERSGVFRCTLRGVGRIDGTKLRPRGLGPTARASGLAEDVRSDDPTYRALSFSPVTQQPTLQGDATARWRQRLDEIVQSLTIVGIAGDLETGGQGAVESPRGAVYAGSAEPDAALKLIPELLPGMEWGDAVTTIVSLDLGNAYSASSTSKNQPNEPQ